MAAAASTEATANDSSRSTGRPRSTFKERAPVRVRIASAQTFERGRQQLLLLPLVDRLAAGRGAGARLAGHVAQLGPVAQCPGEPGVREVPRAHVHRLLLDPPDLVRVRVA